MMSHAWRTRRDGASNGAHVTSAPEVPFILFRVFSGCGSPFKQVEVLTLCVSGIFLERFRRRSLLRFCGGRPRAIRVQLGVDQIFIGYDISRIDGENFLAAFSNVPPSNLHPPTVDADGSRGIPPTDPKIIPKVGFSPCGVSSCLHSSPSSHSSTCCPYHHDPQVLFEGHPALFIFCLGNMGADHYYYGRV